MTAVLIAALIMLMLFCCLNGLLFFIGKIKAFRKARKKLAGMSGQKINAIICGSTYALFAFSYPFCQGCMTLAYKHQSLREDFALLKKYGKAESGTNVIISLAPFTTLYRDGEFGIQRNFYLLNRNEYRYLPFYLYFTNKFCPLLAGAISNFGALFRKRGETPLQDITVSWRRVCHISGFDAADLSQGNRQAIQYNTEILQQMVSFCNERGFRTWIVALPITSKLNQVFSGSFLEQSIYRVIDKLKGDFSFKDYREDPRLCDEQLYRDRCFYLNDTGSRIFEDILINDMAAEKGEANS